MLDRRDRHAENPPRPHHHDLTRIAQVAGQEDDQSDLGELGRLKDEHAGDPDTEVGAVDLRAQPRHPWQQQQQQRHRHDRVAVALELAVVPKRDDRDREQRQPQHEPLRLLAREGRIDPVDHHDPEAGQQRDQGEHVRVGMGQRHPDHDVPSQA